MTNYPGDRHDLQSIIPDHAKENDILQFAEEIIDYVLNELKNNREDWYYRFQDLTPEEQTMLFRALADGFNDSTDE